MKIIELNGKIVLAEGEEELGYLVFRRDEDRIIILSTFVNENAGGKGVAKILNEYAFDKLNEKKKTVQILCSYSKKFYDANKDKYPNLEVI